MKNDIAIVNTTIGPLKQEVGFCEEAADETLFGRLVKLLKKLKGGWYYVETDYGYRGYIHERHLLIDNDVAAKWDTEANHNIIWGIADVMKEPRYQSYSIQLLTRGALVKLTGDAEGSWVQVELPNGDKGWIRREFVKTRIRPGEYKDEGLRKNIIDTALSYLGTQYRWGGKTPLGIDCSGLTSISYLINGIIIYRDSQIKEEFGMKRISKEEMKPADLLYWSGHVALYIGDHRYIHSTAASGGVVINSLNPEDDDYREDLKDIVEIATVF